MNVLTKKNNALQLLKTIYRMNITTLNNSKNEYKTNQK